MILSIKIRLFILFSEWYSTNIVWYSSCTSRKWWGPIIINDIYERFPFIEKSWFLILCRCLMKWIRWPCHLLYFDIPRCPFQVVTHSNIYSCRTCSACATWSPTRRSIIYWYNIHVYSMIIALLILEVPLLLIFKRTILHLLQLHLSVNFYSFV